MSRLSNENLFLLEFLVDQVIIRGDCDCDTPGELCVSFQFLDSTTLDICENDFTSDDSSETCSKTGKSCLFSLTPEQITECTKNFDVCVTIGKKVPQKDKIVIGRVLVSITNLFIELTESKNGDDSPATKTLRDAFDVFDGYGEIIGKIGMYIRMSCFGKLIITQFQMNLEDNSVLFKDKEGQSLYRYKKVKKHDKEQAGDLNTCSKVYFNTANKMKKNPDCPDKSCFDDKSNGDIDDPWENPGCPSGPCSDGNKPKDPDACVNPDCLYFDDNSGRRGGGRSPNLPQQRAQNLNNDNSCGNADCLYFDDKFGKRGDVRNQNVPQQSCGTNQSNRPQNIGNDDSCANPNCLYFDNSGRNPNFPQQNRSQSMGNQVGFYGPQSLPIGKSMVPCNECASPAAFAPPVTSSPINMAPYPNAKPMNPCNECVTPSPCDPNFPPSNFAANQPCVECGQLPQNMNQFGMGRPQFNNMPAIPCIGTNMDAACPGVENMNADGDYRVCPGIEDININTMNNINNQMPPNLCNSTYCGNIIKSTTTTDEKQVLECPDPNQERFILRIGKKSQNMNEQKHKLELELCTPKCLAIKPKPRKETLGVQYDPKDIASGDKKGKKGKGKGKGKKDKGKKKK